MRQVERRADYHLVGLGYRCLMADLHRVTGTNPQLGPQHPPEPDQCARVAGAGRNPGEDRPPGAGGNPDQVTDLGAGHGQDLLRHLDAIVGYRSARGRRVAVAVRPEAAWVIAPPRTRGPVRDLHRHAALRADRGVEVRPGDHQPCRTRTGVDVLEDHAIRPDRQSDDVAGSPLVLDPVKQGMPAALDDQVHQATLVLQPSRPRSDRNLQFAEVQRVGHRCGRARCACTTEGFRTGSARAAIRAAGPCCARR